MRLAIYLFLILLVGCSENTTEYVYKPYEGSTLPSCDEKSEGTLSIVNDSLYLCKDSSWVSKVLLDSIETDTIILHDNQVIYTENLVKNKCRTEFGDSIIPGNSFFLGNSLLGGFEEFGMAASDSSQDYYYRIKDFFSKKGIAFSPHKKAGGFEVIDSISGQNDYIVDFILPTLDTTTGLVVIQIGENVDGYAGLLMMKESVANLLNQVCGAAPNAKVLWVGLWYASEAKQKVIQEVVEQFGVTFVDISDINTEENQSFVGATYQLSKPSEFSKVVDYIEVENDTIQVHFSVEDEAYSVEIVALSHSMDMESGTLTWKGTQGFISDSYVASHPNNEAFKEIASRILGELGYEL